MSLGGARRQKSGEQLELALGKRGETSGTRRSGEAPTAANGEGRSGDDDLMSQVVERSNLWKAVKRVKQNKGSPGIDGMTVDELPKYMVKHEDDLRAHLLAGTYRPQPVRRQEIPKSGGGTRELGIPTAIDRVVQQAMLQVLQPRFDPTFSEHSYGFRPGRSAHDAVRAAQGFIQDGHHWVVDVDLEKFFDRVNHDVLMGRLARRISDGRILGLVRRYLDAGIMANGVVIERFEGMPQGGPLSPLLANVLLDEVDQELEKRGHKFARYADDCNVYVRSKRAGERVFAMLQRLFGRLRLRINEAKSAVDQPNGRQFLGFSFFSFTGGKEVRLRVATKAVEKMKARVRELTRRVIGRSIKQVVTDLRSYLIGWKAYFGVAKTKRAFDRHDGWIRRRLRALQLKQWKNGRKIFTELRTLGLDASEARKVAATAGRNGRWWAASDGYAAKVLLPSYFDRLGVPRLAS